MLEAGLISWPYCWSRFWPLSCRRVGTDGQGSSRDSGGWGTWEELEAEILYQLIWKFCVRIVSTNPNLN